MKIIKKISSIFIALVITIITISLASAAPASKEELRTYLKQIPIGHPEEYDAKNMPTLEKYPKVVDALAQLFVDVKADSDDFDRYDKNKMAAKLYSNRIKKDVLESNSRYKNMLVFLPYVSVLDNYKFTSDYKYIDDQSPYGPMHFCYMPKIIDRNGNEKFDFIWVDKDECKKTVKQMMDGTFDINENIFWKGKFKNDDHDLLFLKHVQDAAIKYFGDIDSFFNDEEFSTIFFKTIFEVITDNGKTPGNDQKMISIVSSNNSAAISDYKRLGKDIIKKSLGYRGHEEGKDYEIVYDKETGYIKELKNLAKGSQSSSSAASTDNSAHAELMNNVLVVVCILLAIVVISAIVVVIVALIKRK